MKRLHLIAILAGAASAAGQTPTPAGPAPAGPAPANPGIPGSGSATLPLSEVLRLVRAGEPPAARTPPPPPLDATLDRLQLTGRLLDDAIDVHAHVEATVLRSGAWTTLPLLELDPATSLADLPEVAGAVLVRHDGDLSLVTDRAGTYAFDLELVKRAETGASARRATLRFRRATLAVLRLQLDEDLFRLTSRAGRRTPEGVVVYPEGDAFALAWERIVAARPEADRVKPPSIEPTVPHAAVSVVSTLEGRRIWRLRYELRFAGARPIVLSLPPGLEATTVYVNGSSVPFTAGREVALEVAPPRAGDEGGTLEVVLVEEPGSPSGQAGRGGEAGAYSLSGTLRFVLPRVSWPVGELGLDLRLPQVFNYAWTGGSLSPAERVAAVEFTHQIPLPGKQLLFHQDLIASSQPSVDVSYDIDLSGSYFK